MTYLDFPREAAEETTSWERSDPRKALVERVDAITFRVMLKDGADSHEVLFARERGAYVGSCDCKGFKFRDHDDSPCAHLCVLRKAEFINSSDMHGQPIFAQDSATLVSSGATETEPEKRPMTDGGEVTNPPVSGADGEVFGRPEERL